MGIGAQIITEGGTRMGALVTLTDLESRERISTQLQVSERMSALGRIMSGVAHEVKNPAQFDALVARNFEDTFLRGRGIAACTP